jgi:GMP synthase-like glutamine amidotransferase
MGFVYVLQHAPVETAGTIGAALRAKKLAPRVVRAYAGEVVPKEIGRAQGLVVMGGPMSANDTKEHPYLSDEKRLVERALRADVPILGVCLGSQLLASVLGAHVSRGRAKEIGWFPVDLLASAGRDRIFADVGSPIVPCHWHGDVFTLPPGAVALAKSAMTRFQAFRYGRAAYGLLFHLEMTRAMIGKMTRTFAGELAEANVSPDALVGGARQWLPRLEPIARGVFTRWAEQAVRSG